MELAEYIDQNLVHSIHTSERRAFRGCRRRWHWAYKDMYYPLVTPPPLEFGVAFHKAMESYYQPETWGIDPEAQMFVAQQTFVHECAQQLKNYKRLNGEPEVDILNEYKERVNLGINMIKHYCTDISPQNDQGFRPVEVEVAFEVPVLSPQGDAIWCKCDQCWQRWSNSEAGKANMELCKIKCCAERGRDYDEDDYREGHWHLGLPVTYGGRLDMLAKDNIGRYWIFDWKTTSRMLDEGKEESFLELDDQVASYCWALSTLGIPVAGFIYVEIKKDYPKPPEELTRLYKGRRFSTNKQAMSTLPIYQDYVASHDSAAYASGLYNDHLAWLAAEGPKFHQRHQIHKNTHEIGEIGNNIYLEALDIVNDPRVYPQPGRFSCPTCLYRQPCLGKNQGEDYQYTLNSLFEKRTRHYYEEKPSTD